MTEPGGSTDADCAPAMPEPSVAAGGPERRAATGGPDSRTDQSGPPVVERRRPRHERRPPNPRVSVVVPAKNEAPNIREILPYLADYHEVIVVVSEDDKESAEAASAALPSAKIIRQTRKGKGNALACGFKEVTGDAIVMFDIDGSADPNEIPRFIRALTEGADLAKGSRFCRGGGSEDITALRTSGNLGLNLLASLLTNTRFTDLCYGYNAFWADQLYMLDLPDTDVEGAAQMLRGDGFEIEALIIGRFALSGAAITEVPSFEHGRYHGHTNLNTFRDGFRVLWTILQDRRYARQIRQVAKRRHASNTAAPKPPGWMTGEPPRHGVRRIKRLELDPAAR
ncbi:glycosyltransferase family 2 protein [Mycolicibacterium sp. CBM1]